MGVKTKMSKTLKELQESIAEAQALVADAEKEYREAAMQAFEEGRLEEITVGSWREIHSEKGVKVYCDRCFTISPQALRHERCPHCAAKMSNAQIYYHTVEKPHYLSNIIEKTRDNGLATAVATPNENTTTTLTSEEVKVASVDCAAIATGEERKEMACGIIKAFKKEGIPYKKIGELAEITESCIANWAVKTGVPRDKAYNRLCNAYKDYFGKDYACA